MTPYEFGYTDMMEKLARGMLPSIRKLFQMGVKPGSGVSLLPYAREAAKAAPTVVGKVPTALGQQATAVARRGALRPSLTQEQMLGQTLMAAPPVRTPTLPRKMMPDVRDIIRQRAQAAGTYAGL